MYDIGCEPGFDPPDCPVPRCPVCLAEAEAFYVDSDGEVRGCDGCLTRRDAWTYGP